jgi:exodeoxyribonuclease V alpha subunit
LVSEAFAKVKLTEIFRQASASSIVTVAHQIDEGILPKIRLSQHYNEGVDEDCIFFDGVNIEETIPYMTQNPEKFGFKSWSDVQVLTPMNRGRLGAENLNLLIQNTVNPQRESHAEEKVGHTLFRVGDRVIQTQNNYDLGVFNGDIGTIISLKSGDSLAVIDYSGNYVRYSKDEMMDVKLAYAITIHKSQGSEYDCAVIVLDTSHFVMLKKNLLYTALTRAKKQAIFLGSLKAFHMAASEKSVTPRQTDLPNKLSNSL